MTKTLLPLSAALLLLPALLLAPATSHAAPANGEASTYVNDEGARVTDRGEVREIVIDDGEAIDGESLKPENEQLYGSKGLIHASMISIRTNFSLQMIALTQDI